jgi:LytR cell envelope-related transcriptional attenuator
MSPTGSPHLGVGGDGRRAEGRGELKRPVDHPTQLPAPQRWRSAALIATSVAAVELCVLVVVGLIVFGKFFHGQVERATDPMAVAQEAVARETAAATKAAGAQDKTRRAVLARRETSVIVLNGNGIPGAAATMAERVHARSYTIAGSDNAPRPVTRSIVLYRPGYEREARRLAHDIGIRRVSPLDGLRAHQLQGAQLALIVGSR